MKCKGKGATRDMNAESHAPSYRVWTAQTPDEWMEGNAPAVIGGISWEGSMGRSILRYKRLGEAYPSGIGLWGSLLQETGKKYVCISHKTLRMIKASVLPAIVKKGESLIFVS